jgi:hypothetical protein
MPTVSAANPPYTGVPTVEPTSDPGVRSEQFRINVDPEQFGAGVGRALSGLGQTIGQGAKEFADNAIAKQELFNQVTSDNATNQYLEGENKILYGDPKDPNDHGFMGLSGEGAMRAAPGVYQQLTDLRKSIHDGLQNQRQQLSFDSETRRWQANSFRTIGGHYDQQFKVHTEAVNKATETNAMLKVATSAQDQATVDAATADAINAGYKQLQLANGGVEPSDQQVWAMESTVRANAATQQIAALAGDGTDQGLARAKQVLATARANGVPFTGPHIEHIQASLDAAQARKDRADEKANIAAETARIMGGKPPAGATPPKAVGPAAALSGDRKTVADNIHQVALKENVDPELALTTAAIESDMGQNMGSEAKSQYGGNIFQLGHDEWASMGGGTRGDRATDIDHGVRLLAQRKQQLADSLGREPTNAEVYLAHQQGVAGATALINNPNTPAGQLVPRTNIESNGGNPDAPASAFVNKFQQRYDDLRAKVVGPSGATAPQAQAQPASAPGGTAPKLEVWGDSLGVGLNTQLKTAGTTHGGDSPQTILDNIQKQPKEYWQGKTITLSSGSNGNQMPVVEDTIKYLQGNGANVMVVGYGPKFPEKNAQLSEMAGRLNVPVIAAEGVGATEGVHPGPQGYASMAGKIKAQAAQQQAPVIQEGPAATTPGGAGQKTAATGPAPPVNPIIEEGPAATTTPPAGVTPIPPPQTPAEALRPDFEGFLSKAYEIDNERVRNGVMRNIEIEKNKWIQGHQTDIEKTKTDVINTGNQLARGDDVPPIDEARIRHLFPKEIADDMVAKQSDAQLIGNALNGIKGKSLKEISDDMTAMQEGRGLPGIHDVTLRERGIAAYQTAATHWAQTIIGTKDTPGDPAMAFASTPGLQEQAQSLAAMPQPKTAADMPAYTTAHETYAQALIGRQNAFGLAPEQSHVLSADQAKGYAAALYKDPANARGELNNLQQTWGSAWPQVWRDITQFGKLPTEYQALGVLDENNAMRLAQGLNEERGGEPGDKKGNQVWTERFGADKVTGPTGVLENVRVNDLVKDFINSIPPSSTRAQQANSVMHSVSTLAFSLMSEEGLDQATAVDKAVHAFTDLYKFMPQGGARVPTAQYDAVDQSAQAVISSLDKSKIMVPRGIGDYPGAPTADDYVAAIKAHPTWINGHDGIELIDPSNARRVVNQEGYPITIPFNVHAMPPPPSAQPPTAPLTAPQ